MLAGILVAHSKDKLAEPCVSSNCAKLQQANLPLLLASYIFTEQIVLFKQNPNLCLLLPNGRHHSLSIMRYIWFGVTQNLWNKYLIWLDWEQTSTLSFSDDVRRLNTFLWESEDTVVQNSLFRSYNNGALSLCDCPHQDTFPLNHTRNIWIH